MKKLTVTVDPKIEMMSMGMKALKSKETKYTQVTSYMRMTKMKIQMMSLGLK